MLTLQKIQTRLKEIESVSHDKGTDDDEQAHLWEKELWADTLHHIALHSVDSEAQEFAIEALKSLDIKFHRWFA